MRSNPKSHRFCGPSSFLLGISLLMLVPLRLAAQSKPKPLQTSEASWACTKGKDFLRDHHGKAVWLDSQELHTRIRKKTAVQTPGTLGKNNLHGTVTLQVLIGKDGSVQCARAIEGHPVAISPAIAAVQDWVFEPYSLDQEPHAVLGEIVVKYDFRR